MSFRLRHDFTGGGFAILGTTIAHCAHCGWARVTVTASPQPDAARSTHYLRVHRGEKEERVEREPPCVSPPLSAQRREARSRSRERDFFKGMHIELTPAERARLRTRAQLEPDEDDGEA